MDINAKIGQLIIAGFPSTTMSDDFVELVKKYKVGNVILFSHNIESVAQLKQLCDNIQSLVVEQTGHRAFIAADQEGGVVTRLPNSAANVPSAMAIASTNNVEYAYQAGKLTAKELLACGVNFNFAPVMDINSNPNNPVIGVRSYGDTAKKVVKYSTQMLKGLRDGGILTAIKHFPGHGDTAVDSHVGLPVVEKTYAELEAVELLPFKAAIQAGTDAVMTTHILFPKLESSGVPATMSRKIITGILKDKLGFKGLVVTDCLEMQAIQRFYGTDKGALAAFTAGADLLCISHTASLAVAAIKLITNEVTHNSIFMQRLDESVGKILQYKTRLKASDDPISIVGCDEHQAISDKISLESISLISGQIPKLGKFPLFVSCYANRSTLASSASSRELNFALFMQQKFGGTVVIPSITPSETEILDCLSALSGASSVIIATYNAHIYTEQLELANRICKKVTELGISSIICALRNPYDLQSINNATALLAAFEYSERAFRSLAKVISLEEPPKGRLNMVPITD